MANYPVRVELSTLQTAFDAVLRALGTEAEDGFVTLNQDYFWSIPSASKHDFDKAPSDTDMTVGSYVDTWEFLTGVASSPDEVPFPYSAANWLAEMLSGIADQRFMDDADVTQT